MAAGEGDLERPPRLELAADLGEVRRPGRRSRRRRSRRPAAATASAASGSASSTRGGAAGVGPPRRRRRTRVGGLAQRRDADDLDAADERAPRPWTSAGTIDPARRPAERGPRPSAGCPAPARTSPPSESSPISAIRPRRRGDLLGAEEDPDRDREVERGAGLAQVGRGEVDGDPARRMAEPGVADRAADPLAGLLERGVGEPDDREPGQTRARRRPRRG